MADAPSITAELAELPKKLQQYFTSNPDSTLGEFKGHPVVTNPWGDTTVHLRILSSDDELITALNSVYLPKRFNAVWHADTKDLEFIYTAYRISEELVARRFDVLFEGNTYRCEFADSSERLMLIACASRPAGPPNETNHRNLESYYQYRHYLKEHPDSNLAQSGRPVSFWVRNIESDETLLLSFARHLNFYMGCFDLHSPTIMIHEPAADLREQGLRHPSSVPFPKIIRARTLNPYLLGLWESSVNATDPFRRFIYLYQILEYRAFYHVHDDILRTIERVLVAPDTISRVSLAAREILEAVADDKIPDPQKLCLTIDRCVEPVKLWEVISPNAEKYSADVIFDGGFRLPAFIKPGWNVDDFCVGWSNRFGNTVRSIRNALVHARENRMVDVIAPTPENYKKLTPWLPPLRFVAMQCLIFEDR